MMSSALFTIKKLYHSYLLGVRVISFLKQTSLTYHVNACLLLWSRRSATSHSARMQMHGAYCRWSARAPHMQLCWSTGSARAWSSCATRLRGRVQVGVLLVPACLASLQRWCAVNP